MRRIKHSRTQLYWRNIKLLMLFLTLAVVASLLWNLHSQRQSLNASLRMQVMAIHSMEMEYRNWVIHSGGVYVQVSDKIQPSPWLSHVPERDITTPSGKRLTLLNSSYVVRLVHEAMRTSGNTLRDHIASLRPINPANVADAWEQKALEAFSRGEKEAASLDVLADGKTYYRYMKPMFTEESCLKCHARFGDKLGDIRGGVSVAIPVDAVMLAGRNERNATIAGHGLVWGLGIIGLFVGGRKQQQAMRAVEQGEETLRINEERLHFATMAGNIGIWDWDIIKNELVWDESMYALYGIRQEDFGGAYDAWISTLHPEDREATDAEIQAALRGEREYAPEFRIVRPDGTVRKIKAASKTYYDAQGNPLRMVGTNIDITERRKAEEAGRAASQYARSLIEASLDPLVTISAEGKITDVNKATEKATGRTRTELIGTDFSDYFTEPEKAGAGYRQVFAKGFVTDYPLALRHRDGHITDVLYNASIYRSEAGDVLGVFAAARDITERKRAEEIRTRLAAIVESSNDAIIGKDLNGIITSWNKGAEKIYGYSAAEIIGKPITVLAPPERHAEIEGFLEKIRRGETVVNYESDRIRKDGTWIYVALTLSPIRDASGTVFGISTIARDISERKRVETELSTVNRTLRILGSTSQAMIRIKDEVQLLDEACRIVVEVGGYRLAWIGFAEHDEGKTLRPVAHAGFDSGYIKAAQVSWGDNERGRGPGGTAIRTGQPSIARHILSDPDFIQWREAAILRGYKSLIALPLISEGQTLGSMGIYSNEDDAFGTKEVEILQRGANDLAFGISALRARTKQLQAENALKQSEEKYRTLVQKIQVAVVVHGADTQILVSNSMAQELLGLSADQMFGKTAIDPAWHFYREDGSVLPQAEYPVNQVLASRSALRNCTLGVHRPQREDIWVLVNADPVFVDTGALEQVVVSFIDISDRKHAELGLRESEEALKEAQRLAHLGSWYMDLATNEVVWSEVLYQMYGFDSSQPPPLYTESMKLFTPESWERLSSAITRATETGISYELELEMVPKGGGVRWMLARGELVRDESGKPVRVRGVVMDITERKRSEAEIRQLNQVLELRVRERTAQLEIANKELEAFSFSVSHDLRTPLRAIDGFSQILLEDYEAKLDAEGCRLLHVVRDNTRKMGALIDDILKFSRAGRTALSCAEIDMAALAREVYSELQSSMPTENLQLEIDAIPPAQCDRAMMRQVFANLLSNALKFSHTRETPEVRVGSFIEGGETVYFVRDNGVGFDMQYADKLFGVFQRLHGVDEFEGTGIGLAIVKRIVVRHGGRVWAEGKVNEGATVYFSIPHTAARLKECA